MLSVSYNVLQPQNGEITHKSWADMAGMSVMNSNGGGSLGTCLSSIFISSTFTSLGAAFLGADVEIKTVVSILTVTKIIVQ